MASPYGASLNGIAAIYGYAAAVASPLWIAIIAAAAAVLAYLLLLLVYLSQISPSMGDSNYAVCLSQVLVRDVASREVISINGDDSFEQVRQWLAAGAEGTNHQGFPVLGPHGYMIGVVTRRDILNESHAPNMRVMDVLKRPPAVIYEENTLRQAADHMARSKVGRLPVVDRKEPRLVLGMITRSDLLTAHQQRLDAEYQREKPNRTGILGWEARGV